MPSVAGEEREREKDWAQLISLWHCMLQELCTLQQDNVHLDFMNSILPNLHHLVRKKINVRFTLTELSTTINIDRLCRLILVILERVTDQKFAPSYIRDGIRKWWREL